MKKYLIMGLALLATLTASAELKETLKGLEKTFKGADNVAAFTEAENQSKAVFEDPATAGIFEIYMVPGNKAWDLYDKMYLNQSMGQNQNPQDMGKALLSGYNYYVKALEVGPYTDAKGKEKKPDEKKIVNTISGHYTDFSNVGSYLWDSKDFKGAYDVWSMYVNVMTDPRFAGNIKNLADSTVAYGNYLKALAAWQADMLPEALDAFQAAIDGGYETPEVYDYALQVANQAQNQEKMFYYAQKGLEKFGTSNPNFLLLTLNGYIEQQQYDQARQLLDEAIAKDPKNPIYYFSMGILEDNLSNTDAAIVAMKKAIELNDEYAVAYFNLGRLLAEKNDELDSKASNLSLPEYNAYKQKELIPVLKESAAAFEKAYALDPDNQADALKYLKNIYYVLEDADNLKRVEQLF